MKKFTVDFFISILIPFIILTYFSGEDKLGIELSLIFSGAIPLIHGIYDYQQKKKINYFSLLGLIGVILTPAIGLLGLSNNWLAAKETLIPLTVGIGLIILKGSKIDFVSLIINRTHDKDNLDFKSNFSITDYVKIYDKTFYLICSSFFLSAILNFVFVKLMVTSSPGTVEYNQELGRMTFISSIVIGICSAIVIILAVYWFTLKLGKITNQDKK